MKFNQMNFFLFNLLEDIDGINPMPEYYKNMWNEFKQLLTQEELEKVYLFISTAPLHDFHNFDFSKITLQVKLSTSRVSTYDVLEHVTFSYILHEEEPEQYA